MQVFGEWAQVEVVELVNDGGGLAFGIVGGRSSGVLVKSVLPGGVADRDGRLRSGDMLLRIGAVCVVGMCARQAAAVLRQCGACVRLLVARPAHSGTAQQQPLGASPAPVVPTRLLADPLELERGLAEAGHEGFGALCDPPAPDPPQPPTIIEERLHHRPVASIVAVVPRGALAPSPRPPPLIAAPEPPPPQPPRLPLDMAVRGARGGSPETLSYEVALSKDAAGLGITVAGYVCEQEELSGIFVKSISEGSSADLCGKIQVNDRIVEVDGVSLHGVTNHRAVALLRDAKGPIVRLKALRYLRGAGFERLQRALAAQDGRRLPVAPPSPSVTSLARYSFSVYDESTVIEPEPESGRHVSPTSPRSPASPTSPDEEIVIGAGDGDRRVQDKWRDILAAEPDWPGHCFQYEIIVGTIMKEKDSGLGISLEGTVRVVGGREVGARHYIRAIAPRSPVARLGLYRVGDELLEVNGWRVLGAHHVEVVSRLRAVTSPVSLVVVRKLTEPLPNSNFARNSVVGGSLQELLAAPQRLIKAKSESSVASLCSATTVMSAPHDHDGERQNTVMGGSLQELLTAPQRLIKAKSESSVASLCSATTVMSAPHDHDEFCSDDLERGRSRSLEPLSGLAMWSDQVEYIQLLKEDRGLGFSILDYLDPTEAGSSVIVVRSVVQGGAAAAHGRLAPGDRLVSVNGVDVARSPLAVAVNAIKSAPKGIVTIGITKPLPCSTVVGGEKANGPSVQSSQRLEYFTKLLRLIMSLHRDIMALQRCPEYRVPSIAAQECVNSLASDEHTGMDSFHECLQEYAEGLEVVQMCLEPEDASIRDEELSALADFSYEENLKNHTLVDNKVYIENKVHEKVNGISEMKSFKSDDSLDDPDDDLTITENDVITLPRELSRRTSLIKDEVDKSVLKQQSKDLSTSDEMVFAVTPTGLERISFEAYWKDSEVIRENKKNDESWTLNSPSDETSSFYDATAKISIQEQNNSLLYIDHEIDGYETCLDDDSSSTKCPEKNGRKSPIKELDKHDKIAVKNIDPRAKIKSEPVITTIEPEPVITIEEAPEYTRPYVEEHIIKQMKSLRIEPLNVNVSTKKRRKSPTKPAKTERRCVEYYNDQAECLQEIQRRKRREEEQRTRGEEQRKKFDIKKLNSHKKNPSEESTDADTYVPGCHKCFLEHAYAITQAYIAEATACKYCEVIRDMLEVPKSHYRRKSAPALFNVDSPGSETEDENFLTVPEVKDRRQSAGPLKYLVPARRSSYVGGMTVSGHKEGGQRWGPPRRVTLRRRPGAPLGVSIVGGKVDIIGNHGGENGERGMFGIFIKNVVPDSPAAQCGELQVGDRILEVDGVDVRTAQHERAVQLIKAAKDDVTLTVQSLVAWKSDSSDVDSSPPAPAQTRPNKTRSIKAKAPKPPPQQHDIKITVTPDTDDKKEEKKETEAHGESEKAASDTAPEKPKPAYSDSDSSDEEDEREMQGRTYSDKGVEIDRASAGAIKRSREEREADPEEEDDFGYTTNKIRKKYASLGDNVVVVKLERVGQIGLGLSLAGHRDRSRMAVFVCGLNPAGAAIAAQPPVKVGDEILEVNGIVLHGRCHLNASAIIKGLVGPVFKFILLRRKAALEDVAVKPLTQFPTPLEEGLDDRFAGYKGVRDITIKKGPAGLGIMIIEGRHTEAGRGIFVSDLQEGSAAEQAGLNIGDMILAVNRDSLLSCTYDSAAAKLKQTEGVVILTVCSPNLKDGETPEDRPKTPQPAASPAKPEPPADPATAQVRANCDTVIEITTNNEVIGLSLLGGNDTLIAGAVAIVLEVYKEGAIAKDGRIKVGDQIKSCNGVEITKDMSNERLCLIIKQKAPKLKMTVYRPEPLQYDEVETELTRKSGRPLGLNCIAPLEGPGLYLGEILPGSPAEVDGKLQRGDWLVSVDGKDVSALEPVAAAAILKLAGNKVPVKVKRFKPIR